MPSASLPFVEPGTGAAAGSGRTFESAACSAAKLVCLEMGRSVELCSGSLAITFSFTFSNHCRRLHFGVSNQT
jgi:hypothetical protein